MTAGRWQALLLALTGVTCVIFLVQAFLVPGTTAYAPFTIQDDARQFLTWMARLAKPGAMPGDLLADYWQSVAPLAWRWLYEGAAALGVAPVDFARVLPPVLLLVSAYASWRVALAMCRGRPAAAFVAAAFVMALLVHEDSIYSATPRAFSPPLFLLFLDGLLRGRPIRVVASLGLLAGIYPTTALVGLTMLGLSHLRVRPRPGIVLTRRSLATVAAATLAVAVPVLSLPGQTEQWAPVLTVAQALELPNLGSADGRSAIVNQDGSVGWLCSARMGFLPEIVPCWSSRWAALPNALLLVPLLVLGIGAALRPKGPRDPDLIYLWALLAGLGWWVVATVFAFKLHLPARYPQRVLSILEWLAIGQLVGLWLRGAAGRAGRAGRAAAALLAVLFAISFLTPTGGLRRPEDSGAMAFLAALPADARIAGLAGDLDGVPALAGRSTLATIEHAIPYHWGYFGQVKQRLEDTLAVLGGGEGAGFRRFAQGYGIDYLVVDRALAERGEVPDAYAAVVPAAVRRAEAQLGGRPPPVLASGQACLRFAGPSVLVYDARCLARP